MVWEVKRLKLGCGGGEMVGARKGKGGGEQKKKKGLNHKRKALAMSAEAHVALWAGVTSVTPGLFDLHTHSTCSDGLLSPDLLLARAYQNGVRVLALTDHDTMAGVKAAIQAARRYGIRIIPGVEISCRIVSRYGELEVSLAQVREGRFDRAKTMVQKLRGLNKPIEWQHVLRIAGAGVAPGRPHVARALLEAGHVGSVQEAFAKYLHDDGPAYTSGAELPADEVVKLIRRTGGVAVLAHPWSLKNAASVVGRLQAAGLHAIEVYRSDGKATAFGPLADSCNLLKLGGSDFHGTGVGHETDLGAVDIPPLALLKFLNVAEPVWSASIEKILEDFCHGHLLTSCRNGQESVLNCELSGGDLSFVKSAHPGEVQNLSLQLSPWLTKQEEDVVRITAKRLGLQQRVVNDDGREVLLIWKDFLTSDHSVGS